MDHRGIGIGTCDDLHCGDVHHAYLSLCFSDLAIFRVDIALATTNHHVHILWGVLYETEERSNGELACMEAEERLCNALLILPVTHCLSHPRDLTFLISDIHVLMCSKLSLAATSYASTIPSAREKKLDVSDLKGEGRWRRVGTIGPR